MALSFEESKRLAAQAATKPATMDISSPVMPVAVDEGISVQATVDSGFQRSGLYTWISDYDDNVFSTISGELDINIVSSQANVTQGNNSQVIPFEMPRYYDGIDLMQMTIQIHSLNGNNEE